MPLKFTRDHTVFDRLIISTNACARLWELQAKEPQPARLTAESLGIAKAFRDLAERQKAFKKMPF